MNTITNKIVFVLAFAASILLAGCTKPEKKLDIQAYQKEIQQWQQERSTRLQREDGWLTLIGLFWLKEGENKFGSDTTNEIVFPPGKSLGVAGSIFFEKGALRITAEREAGIFCNDSVVTAMPILSDGEGKTDPTILKLNTLLFYVIKRGEQYGVRLKDKESPARMNFKGLEYFPVAEKWRVEATFEPYTPAKKLAILNQVGTTSNDSCPGALAFEVDGKQYRLDVIIETPGDKEFFIMFTDETSGKETYGNGRQLYSGFPDANGKVILDFNKAYNWPCVFTPFATCPIPPRQNHLAVRVEAGEKMYEEHF
ncbi:MAG: DUF1684 domain-containing protein [Bacteroidetes bacterium]|nr:MAG: DUF1684 domain-containing protein [Bacteroidota bacterium]